MTADAIAKKRQYRVEQAVDQALQSAAESWPEPLAVESNGPELRAELLPGWLGDFVGELALATQTPPTLGALFALSVVSACVQGRYVAAPLGTQDGYTEPASFWSLSAAPSGSRKTAIVQGLTDPLLAWEKRARDRMRGRIAGVFSEIMAAEARIKALLHQLGKAADEAERTRLRDDIARERAGMPDELFAPRVFVGDTTVERLQTLLVEQRGRVAILSDEGGLFTTLSSTYGGGNGPALDVLLQGYSGGAIRAERASRVAYVERAAVAVGLMLQTDLLKEAAGNHRFMASGLMARFAFALPAPFVGRRDVRNHHRISESAHEAYRHGIEGLLAGADSDLQGRPRLLELTDDARELYYDFAQTVEDALAPGGDLAAIAPWGAKLAGMAVRVALLFELVQTGPAASTISEDSMLRAAAFCRQLIPHARAAHRQLAATQTDRDTDAILQWITHGEREALHEFRQREVQRALHGRFREAARLVVALQQLQADGYLKHEQRKNTGARPSDWWRINPRLFVH